MEREELLRGMKRDFVTFTVPMMAAQAGSLFVLVGGRISAGDLVREIAISSARSASCVVLQNVIEYGLSHASQQKPTFEGRLCMRIAAVTAASTITRMAVLGKRRTFVTVVVEPLIDGLVHGGVFLAMNRREAERYLRSKFPREFEMFEAARAFFEQNA